MGQGRIDDLGLLKIETEIRKLTYNRLQIKPLSFVNHSISNAWMTKCTFAESLQWPVQYFLAGRMRKLVFVRKANMDHCF